MSDQMSVEDYIRSELKKIRFLTYLIGIASVLAGFLLGIVVGGYI